MGARIHGPYLDAERALEHKNPLVKNLFGVAVSKRSNVVVSAGLTKTKQLLELADSTFCYYLLKLTRLFR